MKPCRPTRVLPALPVVLTLLAGFGGAACGSERPAPGETAAAVLLLPVRIAPGLAPAGAPRWGVLQGLRLSIGAGDARDAAPRGSADEQGLAISERMRARLSVSRDADGSRMRRVSIGLTVDF